MYELEINGKVYQFRFGFGFLKAINATAVQHIDGIEGAKQNVGLRIAASGLFDFDVERLVNILYMANQGEKPRITKEALGFYIEDESTDIDKLFDDVLGFLKTSNCTKKAVLEIGEAVEAEKARQEAEREKAMELARAKN